MARLTKLMRGLALTRSQRWFRFGVHAQPGALRQDQDLSQTPRPAPSARPFALETLEPRLLLSADFPVVAPFLADGLDQLDHALDDLFNSSLMNTPLPGIGYADAETGEIHAPDLNEFMVIDLTAEDVDPDLLLLDSNLDLQLTAQELLEQAVVDRIQDALDGYNGSGEAFESVLEGLDDDVDSWVTFSNVDHSYSETVVNNLVVSSSTQLAFDVRLDLEQAANFVIDLGVDADALGLGLEADLALAPYVEFHVLLNISGSGAPNTLDAGDVSLDLTQVEAGVTGSASLVGAAMDFGFLGTSIGAGGSVDISAGVSAGFDNAGASPVFTGTSVAAGSSFDLLLPITIDSGIVWAGAPAGLEIDLSVNPFTQTLDADSQRVELDLGLSTGFDELLDFTRFAANDVIGMINQLTGFFNILADDALIADLAIPFTGADLGDVLDMGDALADMLLYEDADASNGMTATDGLLLAKADSTFEETIPTVEELISRLNSLSLLGGEVSYNSQSGQVEIVEDGVTEFETYASVADAVGDLQGRDLLADDLVFDAVTNVFTFEGPPSFSAAFETVQDLGQRLQSMGVLNGALTFDPLSDELTFAVDFDHTLLDVEASLAFDGDLSPLANISTGGMLTLGGSVGMSLTLGIDFSNDVSLETSDRFFVENAEVSGELEFDTPGGFDAEADFGFVAVTLDGNANLTAQFETGLTSPGSNVAGGRVTIAQLSDSLGDLSDVVVAPSFSGTGQVSLVLGLESPIDGFDGLLDGVGSPEILLLVSISGETSSYTVDTSGLNGFDIARFADFGFGDLVAGLELVGDFLGEFESFGFLDQDLPVINYSVNDLLGFATDFAQSIDNAIADPAGSLQMLEAKLKNALGLSANSDAVALSLDDELLKIELGLTLDYSDSLGIELELSDLIGNMSLDPLLQELLSAATLAGSADLAAAGHLDLSLDFGIDLTNPGQLYLYGTTGLVATLAMDASNVAFRAALGPLGLFVKDGTARIGASFSAGLQSLGDDRILITDLSPGTHFGVDFSGSLEEGKLVDVTLPVYAPSESHYAGDLVVATPANPASTTELFEFTVLGLDEILSSFDPSQLSLFDQVLMMVDGIDLFLEGMQDTLEGELGGVSLPLIGDSLDDAARFIDDFRNGFIADFRSEIENLAGPDTNFVSEQLFQLLGPAGLDLLLDLNGDNAVTIGDVLLDTNIDDPETALEDSYMQWDLRLGSSLLATGLGIDLDLGIPGLGLETEGDIQLEMDWQLDFGFGLSIAEGAYFHIYNPSNAAPELRFNLLATLDDASLTGKLGFLQLTIEDSVSDPSYLLASFAVDVYNKNDTASAIDERLGFSELGSLRLNPQIAAVADVNLDMTLSLNSDFVGDASVFPQVRAEFLLDWQLGDSDVNFANPSQPSLNYSFDSPNDAYVDLGEVSNALQDGLQLVEFQHVSLDLGSYLSDFLLPVLEQIQQVTEPLQPMIDFLTEPLPVISELAGDTSFLDLAESLSNGKFNVGFFDSVAEIITFVNSIPTEADSLWLDFGSFTIFQQGDDLDLSNPNLDLAADEDFVTQNASPVSDPVSNANGTSKDTFQAIKDSGSFSFPILTDVTEIFNLLLGKDVTLVAYDMQPLELAFEYSRFFSIYGPLGARIGGSIGATVDFDFGFDTYGIRKFVDSGFVNPGLIFAGFHVIDGDHPELTISGSLTAAAELNLLVAYGGVGGGIFATVDFDLYDPDRDGKVRVDEMINSAVYANNPLAIFDISGNVTAELFWYVGVDLWLVSWEERGTIASFELVDFEIDFPREPILATDLGGGVLQLNMGEFADQRLNGNTSDGNETFSIEDTGAGVKVSAFGTTQTYDNIDTVVVRAGEGNDSLTLNGSSNLVFDVQGGRGNDVISLAGTSGAVTVTGDEGDDTITTGEGADRVWGNAGNDVLNTNGGNDWVFGDDAKVHEDNGSVDYIKVRVQDTDGRDQINSGAGDDIAIGGGNDDEIDGGGDNDLIIGDRVMLNLSGGVVTSVADTARGLSGGRDDLSGGAGNDIIYGGLGDDQLQGDAGNDTLHGEDGLDELHGGADADTLYGGDHEDTLYGEGGDDTLYGGEGGDELHGGSDNDTLYGEGGADELYGDSGNDTVWGGSDPDLIYGGSGNDILDGEQGDDFVYGEAGLDQLTSSLGSDVLDGGAEADQYTVNMSGGVISKHVTAFDSGLDNGVDQLTLNGTDEADALLLRAGMDDASLAFVAMLNEGTAVERLDYNLNLEHLDIFSFGGDDRFALDDNRSLTTIDMGEGNDSVQVGQMFVTERTPEAGAIQPHDADMPHDGIAEAGTDSFATIETTRGFLSNGISFATSIQGGEGDDEFTVFHNIAVLDLDGDAGNDVFTVRAFALVGSQEPNRERTDISGGEDADLVMYAENAPVNIDGGDGLDEVRIIGTEFSDDFIVTQTGISGAGLEVSFVNIELLDVDGMEGNDRFFVLGTPQGTVVTLTGGRGADSFNLGLDPDGLVPQTIDNIDGPLILEGFGEGERSIGSLGDPLMLPGETNQLPSVGNVLAASSTSITVDPVLIAQLYPDPADLIDLTLEITTGPARGEARLITAYDPVSGLITLDQPWEDLPDTSSSFSLAETNPNLLVDETVQVDVVTVFDNDRVGGASGSLSADRLSGFGMAGDLLVGSQLYQGGVQYLDMENFTLNMGAGADQLSVSGTHTRADGFQTVTLIQAGEGEDQIDIDLAADDGFLAVKGEGGNDVIDASGSSRSVILFGDAGNDQLSGGSADDILLGDSGRIDYLDDAGQVITRLGLAHDFASMISVPVSDDQTPSDQTDGVARDPDLILTLETSSDGNDQLSGGEGNDLMIGGAGGDGFDGGGGADQILGDNARVELIGNDLEGNSLLRIESATAPGYADDWILGGRGDDLIIAGSGSDGVQGDAGNDLVFGDEAAVDFVAGLPVLLTTTNASLGSDDTLSGGDDNDLLVGGTGKDQLQGDAGNDLLYGDHARITGFPDLSVLPLPGFSHTAISVLNSDGGGADLLLGGSGDDIILGQQGSDRIEGGAGDDDLVGGHNVTGGADAGDLIDGGEGNDLIAGDNAQVARTLGDSSPLFRGLVGATLYADGSANVSTSHGADPNGSPGRDLILLDHDQTTPGDRFGDDYIAGGAGNDLIFGQLGNDTLQGDAGIDLAPAVSASVTADGLLLVNPSIEAGSDGDDHIEGNGGNDLIFGNLGQDDLIGGSSDLFGLTSASQRPDGADRLFGGAGIQLAMNDLGNGEHARDADLLLGDNGNIFRILGASGSTAQFNYNPELAVRAYMLLDYTPGGGVGDLGAADELHGEGGDDMLHGMTGNDLLFGEAADDDLIGGTGHDRLYGGGGSDGLIGDDGLIHTSRNGTAEPLQGVTGNAEQTLTVPGPFIGALVYGEGLIHKDVTLLGYDSGASLGAAGNGNDVLFGGLGDDFLHGGEGDDALSGAEALAAQYHSQPNQGLLISGYTAENPLPYDPATGKFLAYDAEDPRAAIPGFLLNFAASDESGIKIDDGIDRLFGDLGNDWLVGGTNTDRLFGGWGNDLLNADDNLEADPYGPDADEYADGDFAYGGAGLDVLIGNTGRDRLFDWSGEFNSYFVPFSQFGEPTVTRQVSPHVVNFLAALGLAEGADASLSKPFGELGLVTQQDAAWGDQHGGPRDPQPGNLSGVQVDDTGGPEGGTSGGNGNGNGAGGGSNAGGNGNGNGPKKSLDTKPDLLALLFDESSGTFDAPAQTDETLWFDGAEFVEATTGDEIQW